MWGREGGDRWLERGDLLQNIHITAVMCSYLCGAEMMDRYRKQNSVGDGSSYVGLRAGDIKNYTVLMVICIPAT